MSPNNLYEKPTSMFKGLDQWPIDMIITRDKELVISSTLQDLLDLRRCPFNNIFIILILFL